MTYSSTDTNLRNGRIKVPAAIATAFTASFTVNRFSWDSPIIQGTMDLGQSNGSDALLQLQVMHLIHFQQGTESMDKKSL